MQRNSDASTSELISSAQKVAEANDLLYEILLLVPLKSLIICKAVSRNWRSLIEDPLFYRIKSRKITPATGLFLNRPQILTPFHFFVPLNEDSPVNDPSRNLNFDNQPHQRRKIIASCNGLLLLSTTGHVLNKCDYFMYNPTTNQRTTIPHPNCPLFRDIHGENSILSMNLAFDPARSPYYNVVCVHLSDPLGEDFVIEMYSSDTGLWKNCVTGLKRKSNFTMGVFWNGAINWISGKYFNVEKENLGEFPMPSIPAALVDIRYYGESHGHLHLVVSHPNDLCFGIHEMEENYGGWFLKYLIDLDALIMNLFHGRAAMFRMVARLRDCPFQILSIIRGENDEESFLVLCVSDKLIRYNILNRNFKRLHESIKVPRALVGLPQVFQTSDAFQFIESLAGV